MSEVHVETSAEKKEDDHHHYAFEVWDGSNWEGMERFRNCISELNRTSCDMTAVLEAVLVLPLSAL